MTFTVKLPNIETNEITEHKFNNVDEIAKFLNIAKNTVYSIINNTCAFNRDCTIKLRGIKIIKDDTEKMQEIIKNSTENSLEIRKMQAKLEIKKIKEKMRMLVLEEKELKAKKLNKDFLESIKCVNV